MTEEEKKELEALRAEKHSRERRNARERHSARRA